MTDLSLLIYLITPEKGRNTSQNGREQRRNSGEGPGRGGGGGVGEGELAFICKSVPCIHFYVGVLTLRRVLGGGGLFKLKAIV